MRSWHVHNYIVGDISITLLSSEIIIIYRRKNSAFIKSISWRNVKRAGMAFAAVCLCLAVLFISAGINDIFFSEASWYDEIKKKTIANKEFEEPHGRSILKIVHHTIKQG